MPKWIFVCDHEFSDRYVEFFDLLSISAAGFIVEIWVLRFKGIIESRPRIENPCILNRFLDSLTDLAKQISNLNKADIVTPVYAFATQNLATDKDVRSVLATAPNLVCFDEYTQVYFQNTFWPYLRILATTPRLWKRFVLSFSSLLGRVLKFRLPRFKASAQRAVPTKVDFVFSTGTPSVHDPSILKEPANLKVVPPVKHDSSTSKTSLEGKKRGQVVLVDGGFDFHTDNEKLPQLSNQKKNDAEAFKRVRTCVLRVASFLASIPNHEVVIAAHPNARYPADIYSPFPIYFDDTSDLIEAEETQLVVTFGSSLALAISLLGKPQCVVDTETALEQSLSCVLLSRELNVPLWRLNAAEKTWQLPVEFTSKSLDREHLSMGAQALLLSRPHERTSLAISTMKTYLAL